MTVPFKVDLTGKVAVVTGGGGVLGSYFAKALAECGAKVAIMDLNQEPADKVAAEINAAGGTAIGVAANVLDKEAIEKAKEIIDRELGTCDILLNGAGGNNPKGSTEDEFYNAEEVKNSFAQNKTDITNEMISATAKMISDVKTRATTPPSGPNTAAKIDWDKVERSRLSAQSEITAKAATVESALIDNANAFNENTQVKGCALVQLIAERKLKFETFLKKSCESITGFSSNARTYER